ncbi:excisionase family DNA-binding protein [Mycobacteroides abscessus subsp. abscessus]|uniref:excisionase family DNA-binding protein n=1 Tax=Mycobacteroides abscessus TaxID=36809 RepID=UPI00092BEBEA|nr:excisionase family DNA-binding protein [Mycobacteroides abscessus]AWG47977.1 helix-turn-helix domain-containing protein [Mycobacteroides abscessus]MDM2173836.1 excisionase family DNA-binding protein [Mycobacteroides abscessus]MDM2179000.1 excisionase family DNA-binding protein [Mycobacteroides abscessus]MDM2208515.1 excisionase family DNA-binding protein [Mycobacteroides abscessus]MDM2212976.1 excisionase family DNA-binding protein [Mycobacteroides abscessus]
MNTPRPPARSVTPRYAADLAQVHVSTVRRWIKDGHLKAWRAGPRLLRIDLDELTAFLGGGGAA